MKYQFQNCDGDKFPETYNSVKDAIKDCSDFKSYRYKEGDVYYTREGGMIFPKEDSD